jgi:DNA/RNA-binding domain of Phe-tRNA-synthetase-like protein
MEVEISDEIAGAAGGLVLGVVQADVQVTRTNGELWGLLQQRAAHFEAELAGRDLGSFVEIAAVRDAYKRLGKDPSRYRGSAEALLRRVAQRKGVYQVNSLVDVNNLVSLETRHPVGVYDLARVAAPISFRVGRPGEQYQGIGKDMINLEGLPIFSDPEGPFGSPTSDSRRAMITVDTRRAGLVIIAFSGAQGLDEALVRARTLLTDYAAASNVETRLHHARSG